MKRLLPAAVVLVSLLAVAGMVTWLLRDTLARSVTNHLLDGTGLHVTELAGFRPSFTGTTVAELAVELAGSGRIQRFHDIEADYSVTGLRSGQLRGIRIGRADLDMAAGTSASEPEAEAPRLTDVSEMIRQAPLRSIHIDDLRVSGQPMALTLRWRDNRLTGRLADGATDIQLDVDWQVAEADDVQPSSSSAAPFEAGLRAQTGSLPALEMDLTVVPRNGVLQVQVSSDLDSDTALPVINAVAKLLSLSPLEYAPQSVSAGITARASVPDALEIPRTLQLTATLEAGGNLVLPASSFADVSAGVMEGHWQEPVTLTLELRGSASEPELTVTGQHMAMAVPNVETDTFQLSNAALTLGDYRLHCLSPTTCDFSVNSTLQAESAALAVPATETPDSIQLREPSLTVPTLEGTVADNTLSLQASAGTLLALPEAVLGALSARNTEATLHSAASLDIPLASIDELRLQAGELSVALPLLRNGDHMAGLELRAQDLDTRPMGAFMLDTEIQLSNAYTNLFSLNLWDATLTADIAVDDGTAGFDATLVLNGHPAAIVNGEHDLAAFTGQGRLEVPDVTFDESGNRLSDFIDPLPVPADLLSGTVGGQAELQWHRQEGQAVPAVTGIVDLALTDVAGYFDSVGFIDLGTRIHARLDEDWQLQSLTEEQFRIGRLDAGVIIEDIETIFRFDSAGPSIQLREAGMAVFGGRIMADRLEYDARAECSTNTLILDRLDMARVLSLSAYEGVTATGIVSGEIPLTITGTRFTVSGGTISALPPGGSIRYRDAPADTGNANLDLVYSALGNYRYDRLDAEVDYMDDGELLLSVSMEGVAPDVGDGQRINFNVNISDNIPDLLESLQAGRDIAESLELEYGTGE